MRTPETDRSPALTTDCKNQTMRYAVDKPVCAISRLSVVERLGSHDRQDFQVHPARQRNAVLGKIEASFVGSKSNISYIRFTSMWSSKGAM